jgi:hypothetical protein
MAAHPKDGIMEEKLDALQADVKLIKDILVAQADAQKRLTFQKALNAVLDEHGFDLKIAADMVAQKRQAS